VPYYRGDNYYRGDYYRAGDFLGIGSALKSVAKFAYNTIVPAPVRAAVSAVGAVVHPSLPAPKTMALTTAAPASQFGLINVGGQGVQSGILNIAGAGPSPGMLTAGLPTAPGMKGYHLNRETYETRGGGTSRWGGSGNLQIHPKGTVLVKNRRMNVGNARALKRALRRAGGFARLARRVMSFTHPRAGRGHFKFRKRAKR
jgi:hypothetical protein